MEYEVIILLADSTGGTLPGITILGETFSYSYILMSIVCSSIGSFLLLAFVYWKYTWRVKSAYKKGGYAECWWLPSWNCFRFVVRNMHNNKALFSIKYRASLRKIKPSNQGSSVNTFEDTELDVGERLSLLTEQDLPAVCFRLERQNDHVEFIRTDKSGVINKSYDLHSTEKIIAHTLVLEYSYKMQIRVPFQPSVLREAIRRFVVPLYTEEDEWFFVIHLLKIQKLQKEQRLDIVFENEGDSFATP